jgi:hypothetical protein
VTEPIVQTPGDLGIAPRRRFRTLALVVVAGCAIGNICFRGPVFGPLPYLIFTVPPAALIGYVLWLVHVPRAILLPLAALIALGISYWVSAPPTTARLFENHLATAYPLAIRDLQRWDDNWSRDPAYHLRFYVDAKTVETIVWNMHLEGARVEFTPQTPLAYQVRPPRRALLPVPAWWNPAELRDPQLWRGVWKGCGIELWHDPGSGLVYVSVDTT